MNSHPSEAELSPFLVFCVLSSFPFRGAVDKNTLILDETLNEIRKFVRQCIYSYFCIYFPCIFLLFLWTSCLLYITFWLTLRSNHWKHSYVLIVMLDHWDQWIHLVKQPFPSLICFCVTLVRVLVGILHSTSLKCTYTQTILKPQC